VRIIVAIEVRSQQRCRDDAENDDCWDDRRTGVLLLVAAAFSVATARLQRDRSKAEQGESPLFKAVQGDRS
jgi:hypothetical protein